MLHACNLQEGERGREGKSSNQEYQDLRLHELQLSTAQRVSYCYARAQSAQLEIREREREREQQSEWEHKQVSWGTAKSRLERKQQQVSREQADYSWIYYTRIHEHTYIHAVTILSSVSCLYAEQQHHERTHRGSLPLFTKGVRKRREERRRLKKARQRKKERKKKTFLYRIFPPRFETYHEALNSLPLS